MSTARKARKGFNSIYCQVFVVTRIHMDFKQRPDMVGGQVLVVSEISKDAENWGIRGAGDRAIRKINLPREKLYF